MFGEAKKLHIIEEILKVENDSLLDEVESILAKSRTITNARKSFGTFAGMMTDDEANELETIIKEGCE